MYMCEQDRAEEDLLFLSAATYLCTYIQFVDVRHVVRPIAAPLLFLVNMKTFRFGHVFVEISARPSAEVLIRMRCVREHFAYGHNHFYDPSDCDGHSLNHETS